jgi:hypothetical protein
MFRRPEYGTAASVVEPGEIGTACPALESADLSSPDLAEDGAASFAWSKSVDVIKTANAAVAIILVFKLIVASRAACRDHRSSRRRVNSTREAQVKFRIP